MAIERSDDLTRGLTMAHLRTRMDNLAKGARLGARCVCGKHAVSMIQQFDVCPACARSYREMSHIQRLEWRNAIVKRGR